MIVSLAALSILDAGPLGQLQACAAAGFSHAGLRLNPLLASDESIAGDAAKEKALFEAMEETGLSLLEVGVFPIKPDMDVDGLLPVLKLSQRLGGRFIVCPVEDDDLARRRDTFMRLADYAKAHGMMALVEFNPYSACRTLAEAVSMVESTSLPHAALVIDALHLSRSGGHPSDLTQVPSQFLQLVHFCDAPAYRADGRSAEELRRESRTARLLPGEGELWLRELIEALPPQTPISIEAPSAAHAHLSAAERAKKARSATMEFLHSIGRAWLS
jgi:sugar phosphate isomerase/epimerase